jgi:hypothetical protein
MEGFMISGTDIAAFGGSRIPRSTIEAYLATEHRIQGAWLILLKIGQHIARLGALYRRHSVEACGHTYGVLQRASEASTDTAPLK